MVVLGDSIVYGMFIRYTVVIICPLARMSEPEIRGYIKGLAVNRIAFIGGTNDHAAGDRTVTSVERIQEVGEAHHGEAKLAVMRVPGRRGYKAEIKSISKYLKQYNLPQIYEDHIRRCVATEFTHYPPTSKTSRRTFYGVWRNSAEVPNRVSTRRVSAKHKRNRSPAATTYKPRVNQAPLSNQASLTRQNPQVFQTPLRGVTEHTHRERKRERERERERESREMRWGTEDVQRLIKKRHSNDEIVSSKQISRTA